MFSIDITLSTATLKPDPRREYLSAALKSDPQHVERCTQIRPAACISQRQNSPLHVLVGSLRIDLLELDLKVQVKASLCWCCYDIIQETLFVSKIYIDCQSSCERERKKGRE